ncbi:MAG: HAMP domain-containing protein [Nitrospiraceae bacterium]|nr:MAG: HAMP domain-containing protein [Nitrospiraceae bacterium]
MKLKIWHKMFIGIFIPSFIALIGGILTYKYINEVSKRQEYVQTADDFREHALEMRRNEKNFFHYKNTDHYNNLTDAIEVISNNVSNISRKTIEEIGENYFSLLNKSIRNYSDLLNRLYQSYQQETAVVERVREEGRDLEAFISRGQHAQDLTTSFVLHLRLLEKNYMLFRDRDSYISLNKGLSDLKNVTPICNECFPYINAVHNLFNVYSISDSIANDLQLTGNRIEETTRGIAQRERQKISSFIKRTQMLLLIALGLLCTLGPLIVYRTATYIVAPINRLADITRKISEGDIALRAPLREHDETFTLALSFNTMLDNLQLTQESLERSLELLHEKQTQLVAAQKLASIGTLASGVAHELNNPLNNIYLAAQIMGKELDRESCPQIVRETMKDIFSQTLRVKRIVSDLLEFAREKAPELKRINLVGVIKDVISQMTTSGQISGIQFNLEGPENIDIPADRHLLEQAFINLFSNAVDAMQGSGTLSIKTDKADGSVRIDVSDTGKGITPEDIARIFDPFFTTKEKGTGLGLAIVYGIIGKHSGEISVKSAPDKGTTFTITLPLENDGLSGRETA